MRSRRSHPALRKILAKHPATEKTYPGQVCTMFIDEMSHSLLERTIEYLGDANDRHEKKHIMSKNSNIHNFWQLNKIII